MARVLVVDDEPNIRELVRLNLEIEGHDVLLAREGMEALSIIAAELPELVVLDLMMPVMDGWEVLRRLKADPDARVSEIPVLLLTAKVDDLDQVRGGIEGALRYITKPFAMADLHEAVAAALEGGPEPLQRRQAQHAALERLARIEKGESHEVGGGRSAPRPRLTRFEQPPPSPSSPRLPRVGGTDLSGLSAKQLELLTAVSRTKTVRDAAEQLQVSRSNVYASLRRIARKLDVHSVPQLVTLARGGTFDLP